VAGGRIELAGLTKRFTAVGHLSGKESAVGHLSGKKSTAGHRSGHESEVAVDGIDLTVTSGEFFSLLGPSGCGKTTTLRLIAGFEQPTSGKILLDGVDMSGVPPHKRNVNTVFQSYALFPFLSAFDNVAFGLRSRNVGKAELKNRVNAALDLVSMGSYAKRRPGMLSGGQQQRVALARALVLNPAVLLLDEPLGALDAKLRRSLKVELKALQERVGITFLYVTHDQEEALTMSDRLAVMNAGRIVQTGTPREVYEEPADAYVADFLGVSNLMEVEVTGRGPGAGCDVKLGETRLTAERGATDRVGAAHVAIRPERVRIEPHGSDGPNRVPGMVERLVFLGAATQVMLRLGPGVPLQALIQNDGDHPALTLAQGTPVHVYLAPDALRVLGGSAAAAVADEGPLVAT
jgi:spermidine/putrescine transport system ATP-binding protein